MNRIETWLARRQLDHRASDLYDVQPNDGPYRQAAKHLNARDLMRRLRHPHSECHRDKRICTAHLSLFDPRRAKCDFWITKP